MIKHDSILRRLPALEPKQALVIDGIRHAAEIAGLAQTRLRESLTAIATCEHDYDSRVRDLFPSAFLDAWSIVDVIDRFRALWLLLPKVGVDFRSDERPVFAEVAQPVRDLRNVADHLAQRMEYLIAKRSTALGTLSWCTIVDASQSKAVICAIVPGTIGSRRIAPAVNPAGCELEVPTGLIHLSAGEHTANLSMVLAEMQSRVRQLEVGFEGALRDRPESRDRPATDVLVKLAVSLGPRSLGSGENG